MRLHGRAYYGALCALGGARRVAPLCALPPCGRVCRALQVWTGVILTSFCANLRFLHQCTSLLLVMAAGTADLDLPFIPLCT